MTTPTRILPQIATASTGIHGRESIVKTYSGVRAGTAKDVTVNHNPLNARPDLWPTGPKDFDWGNGNNRSARLALAILAEHLGDDQRAVALHRRFHFAVVVHLASESWSITTDEIEAYLTSVLEDP